MIFYSPLREQYLVLDTEKDWKGWREHIDLLAALKGRTEKAYGNADPVKRQKELAVVGEEAHKLFGDKPVGRTSGVMEELLLVKGNLRFGKCNSWVHVAPYLRNNAEVSGHWKKNDDKATQKRLDKLLKNGKFSSETTPLFEKKAKAKLFNGSGLRPQEEEGQVRHRRASVFRDLRRAGFPGRRYSGQGWP